MNLNIGNKFSPQLPEEFKKFFSIVPTFESKL